MRRLLRPALSLPHALGLVALLGSSLMLGAAAVRLEPAPVPPVPPVEVPGHCAPPSCIVADPRMPVPALTIVEWLSPWTAHALWGASGAAGLASLLVGVGLMRRGRRLSMVIGPHFVRVDGRCIERHELRGASLVPAARGPRVAIATAAGTWHSAPLAVPTHELLELVERVDAMTPAASDAVGELEAARTIRLELAPLLRSASPIA